MAKRRTRHKHPTMVPAKQNPVRDAGAGVALARQYVDGCQAIGEFLFEFSQLEFTIRAVLAGRIKLAADYFDIVTAPYDFVALCNVTRAIACKQHPDRKS